MRRSFVRALSAAALAIVLTAGTVFAAVESKVSLTIVDHVVFHGHVTSTKDACVVGAKSPSSGSSPTAATSW